MVSCAPLKSSSSSSSLHDLGKTEQHHGCRVISGRPLTATAYCVGRQEASDSAKLRFSQNVTTKRSPAELLGDQHVPSNGKMKREIDEGVLCEDFEYDMYGTKLPEFECLLLLFESSRWSVSAGHQDDGARANDFAFDDDFDDDSSIDSIKVTKTRRARRMKQDQAKP